MPRASQLARWHDRNTGGGGGGGGGPTTYVSDDFNRANSSTGIGTADTGQTWTNLVGTYGITSNTAYCVSQTDGDTAVVDAAASDGKISVVLSGLPNTGIFAGLIGRGTDSTHYYLCQVAGNGGLTLYVNNAGAFTSLGTASITLTAGDTMALSCIGTAIALIYNGVTKISATNGVLTTGTKWGFRQGGTNATTFTRYDTLRVTSS